MATTQSPTVHARISLALAEQAQRIADEEQRTLSSVVHRALHLYVNERHALLEHREVAA